MNNFTRIALFLLLAVSTVSRAELVTVVYEGTINQIDPALVGGPFSLGQTISGSYTYENDQALNPDINPGTVGQYAIASSSDIAIGAQSYASSPGLGLAIFNDVDGFDADVGIAAPPINGFNVSSFSVSLRDLDSTVFNDDSLPAAPPALSEFETARLLLVYVGGGVALIEAAVTLHEVQTDPTTLQFSGPLFDKFDAGSATYSGVDIDDIMSGEFTIGATSAGSSFDPPTGTYFFPGASFFGEIRGDNVDTSTEGSVRPLEVRFEDNLVSDQEAIDLFNEILGTSLPAGTLYDLAEIETDVTVGNRRIEFGLSFVSLNLNTIVGNGYRTFPTLAEVDIALYFVIEEVDDDEIYNALGLVDSFGPAFTPGEATDMLVTGFNSGTGMIDIAYTPGCAADSHTLRYGSLSQVSTYGYTGQICDIGAGGTESFDPGSGDAFFLIVANDGTVEGSYGQSHAGIERPADPADTVCGLVQELSDRCDP